MILKIGTRGSKLALAQSRWVQKRIETQYPHIQVRLNRIQTTGDKVLDSPLSKIGGKGLFVKEIEEALLKETIDVAVHSVKDVPAELPDDLMLSAFTEREDPQDALISDEVRSLEQLPPGSRVGTSSLRRGAQLLHMRPDLELVPLRGNVDTRLKKLKSGGLKAIILAVAGLRRLGLSHRITQVIPWEQLLPAIGQGALGLEIRRHDQQTRELLRFMNHEPTQLAVQAERAFLRELEGGCQVPIAALGRVNGDRIHLRGLVAELDGSAVIRDEISGQKGQAKDMGITLAKELRHLGADRILARIYTAKDM